MVGQISDKPITQNRWSGSICHFAMLEFWFGIGVDCFGKWRVCVKWSSHREENSFSDKIWKTFLVSALSKGLLSMSVDRNEFALIFRFRAGFFFINRIFHHYSNGLRYSRILLGSESELSCFLGFNWSRFSRRAINLVHRKIDRWAYKVKIGDMRQFKIRKWF